MRVKSHWNTSRKEGATEATAEITATSDEHVGVSIDERCLCDIRVEGRNHTALVDTGAVVTLVDRSVLVAGVDMERRRESQAQLRSASGHLIDLQFMARLKFEIAGEVRLHWTYVCRSLPYQVIIGFDFIRANGLKIDGQRGTIEIGERRLSIRRTTPALPSKTPLEIRSEAGGRRKADDPEIRDWGGSACFFVTLEEDLQLPPQMGTQVKAVFDRGTEEHGKKETEEAPPDLILGGLRTSLAMELGPVSEEELTHGRFLDVFNASRETKVLQAGLRIRCHGKDRREDVEWIMGVDEESKGTQNRPLVNGMQLK